MQSQVSKPQVGMSKVGMCVWQSVTVCVSMFEQELCPPYPFQSHTQQWTYHCAGLLINSPVEPLDLKGCYISSGSWKYTRSCGGRAVVTACYMEQFVRTQQHIVLVTSSRYLQDCFQISNAFFFFFFYMWGSIYKTCDVTVITIVTSHWGEKQTKKNTFLTSEII